MPSGHHRQAYGKNDSLASWERANSNRAASCPLRAASWESTIDICSTGSILSVFREEHPAPESQSRQTKGKELRFKQCKKLSHWEANHQPQISDFKQAWICFGGRGPQFFTTACILCNIAFSYACVKNVLLQVAAVPECETNQGDYKERSLFLVHSNFSLFIFSLS